MMADDLEAIYTLSPAQQGMLIETLSHPQSGIHLEQITCVLHGELDLAAFTQAWRRILDRHAIFRTCFVWKDQDEPLQMAHRQVEVPLEWRDLRGLPSSQRQEHLDTYLKEGRDQGFQLSRAPLMRLALFQTDERVYHFVWTHHHILMDGWSQPLVFREFINFYEAFSRSQDLQLKPSRPYKDYIAWLKRQDLSRAEEFWRETLRGFHETTPLGKEVEGDSLANQQERYDEQKGSLPAPATSSLELSAQRHNLTLNTVVQGVWALLLCRYSAKEDIVFGVTVSGRPAELTDIESTIGLFINTLPVRVRLTPGMSFWSWLREIQDYNLRMREYEFCPSGKVHQQSELQGAAPLFESILIYENYPVDASISKFSSLVVDIQPVSSRGARTKYALTILVTPSSNLGIRFIYDTRRFEATDIVRVVGHFQTLLQNILGHQDQSLMAILEGIPEREIPQVRALRKQIWQESGLPQIGPRSPIEEVLIGLWTEVLGVQQLSIHDNFYELGGHSLVAVQLLSRLRDAFQIELPMRGLFENPTIARLGVVIAERKGKSTNYTKLAPIVPASEQRFEPFPLTDIQQAYWVGRHDAFEIGNVANHIYLEVESTDLDLERFGSAWQRLIDRHDMLRAVVLPDGRQQVLEHVPPYQIGIEDLRKEDPESVVSRLEEIRERMSHEVRPPDQWPLFEVRASRLNDRRIRLQISIDLMNVDAGSFAVLSKELAHLYANPEASLPALELSFRDHVLAEVALRETELYHRSQTYWMERLTTLPPAPELPIEKNPSAVTKPRFERRMGRLEPDTWRQLKTRATQMGLTSSGLLLAAYAEVLAVWSQSSRFTINVTLFNRLPLHPQVDNLVGDFTSINLLAVDNSQRSSFEVRARRIQEQLWADLDHRYFGGVRILRELVRLHGRTSGAVMPVVFTSTLGLGKSGQSPWALISALGEVVYSSGQTSQVWLDHQVREEAGSLVFTWDAVEELFPLGYLDDMFEAYNRLLQRLTIELELWRAEAVQLLPDGARQQRAIINSTEAPIPAGLAHTLFTAQALKKPHHLAVVSGDCRQTYEDLYRRSNRLGRSLRDFGACPNRLIAVVMEKGWEQIVAVLGILQSGAAYLPIDPEFPAERIRYLLENGQVELALTQSRIAETLPRPGNIRWLCVDDETWMASNADHLEPVQKADDLAYVLYTSGSTGHPKGVMIDHQSVVNRMIDVNRRFDVGPGDRVLSLTALQHDLSVYDIFGALAAGGTIVMPDAAHRRDPSHWERLIVQERVTIWNSVPTFMEMLVEYLEHSSERDQSSLRSLRLALLSGDWIPVQLPDRIRSLAQNAAVVSLGGPTETTVWDICYPVQSVDPAWKSIPYGRPMTNAHYYVLNEALYPCPVWVPGQIYIGGVGLARGYWRDEEKTQASFFLHPETGERLYRSGDLGRYRPDGYIEFLGRIDLQVKIRGNRVELGEIEATLAQHPSVREAVVAAVCESPTSTRLAAYIVLKQGLTSPPNGQNRGLNGSGVDFQPHQSEDILNDPLERIEFKLKQLGVRKGDEGRTSIQLNKPEPDESLVETYLRRQSYRSFREDPIPFQSFGAFLSSLLQLTLREFPLPKYRYPSAGSLYPVQTYLYIKPDRVEGITPGAYYYHPGEHRLILLARETSIDRSAHAENNRSIFDQSAFSIFLIGELQAVAPLYGAAARDFCMLEAGYMSQLMMMSSAAHRIGMCPVGGMDFERFRDLFGLGPSQIYLHSLFGGLIDPSQSKVFSFLHEISSASDSAPSRSEQASHANGLVSELKSFLSQRLPEYMAPSAFILVESLPLTPNGKVNRKALADSNQLKWAAEIAYVAPQTEVERAIGRMLQEALSLEKVGLHDNFFDLGGNSVHLVQIHSKLREAFQRDIPLVEMFRNPTIASLAKYLSQEPSDGASIQKSLNRARLRRESKRRRQEIR